MIKKLVLFTLGIPFVCILAAYCIYIANYKWDEYKYANYERLDKSLVTSSQEEHKIIPLYDGALSLATRIDLIEKATSSIELEFFIYDLDFASQIITKKLIQKAQEGVEVRLMVDFSLPVFKLAPLYTHFLKKKGIKVKYYNTSSLSDFLAVQHRSHRKLLIVDDKYFITGGRNIANDYFDLNDQYNFLDADILVEGPITKKVRESFDIYWNSEMAITKDLVKNIPSHELQKAKSFTNISKADEKLFTLIDQLKVNVLKAQTEYFCHDISFITDFPGVSVKNRLVYKEIEKLINSAKYRVMGETPYFVIRPDGMNLLRRMHKKNLKVDILTNGLYATDAYYTVSALYPALDELSQTDINLYAYDGSAVKNKYQLPIKFSKRWGIHSKRAIIDDKTLIIGTYNVDPRSANLNSELIVVCKDNAELVELTQKDIESRLQNAKKVVSKQQINTEALLYQASLLQKMKFYFVLPIASMFDFLL